MRPFGFWLSLFAAATFLLVGGGGCASFQNADQSGDDDSSAVRSDARSFGLSLAPQSESVRTVQLYRGSDEHSFPIMGLRSSESITLEFDLIGQQGRPLSIYFEHANREWKRDLSPSQFLESYHNDQLLDYQTSKGTEVPYVHYQYQFPNDDIRFRISGNYVLRVTERGRRDSVLFERPFFVSDETGHLEMGGETIPIPGQRQRSVRPVAQYEPPSDLRGDPFGYAVCFVRNGRLPDTRCRDRPLLGQQPRLEFELERDRAFAPTTADYTVDLGNLRSSRGIERMDWTVSPFHVLLEPDYAQFSGQDLTTALHGQIVVRESVTGRADPALTAEYVETTFAFVPPGERPLQGGVVVGGSFSNMDPEQGTRMQWVEGRQRYEGEVLLKQGRYQYFYDGSDSRLKREIRRSQSRRQNTYTTFVYYEDPSRNTDRLLRVESFDQQ